MSTVKIAPQIQRMREAIHISALDGDAHGVHDGEDVISVDRIASKLAHLYEKLRYSVDNKEEHLLRRNAIDRMLTRRLSETFRRGSVSRFLVTELVRAGYLPNNKLPERLITDVEVVVGKITMMIDLLPRDQGDVRQVTRARTSIIALGAMEIEEILFPTHASRPVLDAYYLTVRDLVDVKDMDLEEDIIHMQVYTACARSLFGYDEKGIFWILWNVHYPEWRGEVTEDQLMESGYDFLDMKSDIDHQIAHPLNWRLMPKLRDYAIFFNLIRESISKKPTLWTLEQLNIADVKRHISDVLAEKYDLEHELVKRRVSRTIIYILITKTILAFLIELPYDMARFGRVHMPALIINVVFHPVLLFFMTRIVRLPRSDSKEHTQESILAILTDKELPRVAVRVHRRKSVFGAILTLTYLFFFAIVFAGIIWTLQKLEFNIVSGGLFIFFLTLVSYFGLRLRARARRWRVTSKTTSARSFFVDLLTLPIVQAGQWFSKKFDSINIFVFLLDFVIETPFKVVVEIVEGFTQYLREKKESME